MNINSRALWIIPVSLIALSLTASVSAQEKAYDLTINNQAVAFNFINKTCNGGRIDNPPSRLPVGSTQFRVQEDARQGCMLRYSDKKSNILGIWIQGSLIKI